MMFRHILKQLKEYAVANSTTSAQAAQLTKQQVISLTDLTAGHNAWEPGNEGVLIGLRLNLMQFVERREFETDKEALRGMIDIPAMKARWPDVAVTKNVDSGKRAVTVWLEGLPPYLLEGEK